MVEIEPLPAYQTFPQVNPKAQNHPTRPSNTPTFSQLTSNQLVHHSNHHDDLPIQPLLLPQAQVQTPQLHHHLLSACTQSPHFNQRPHVHNSPPQNPRASADFLATRPLPSPFRNPHAPCTRRLRAWNRRLQRRRRSTPTTHLPHSLPNGGRGRIRVPLRAQGENHMAPSQNQSRWKARHTRLRIRIRI